MEFLFSKIKFLVLYDWQIDCLKIIYFLDENLFVIFISKKNFLIFN